MFCHWNCLWLLSRHLHKQQCNVTWWDVMRLLWQHLSLLHVVRVVLCLFVFCFLYVRVFAGFIIGFCVVKPEGKETLTECNELLPETTPSYEGVNKYIIILSFRLLFHVPIRRSIILTSVGTERTHWATLMRIKQKTVTNDCKPIANIRRKHLPQPFPFWLLRMLTTQSGYLQR
jgi:hypothetical protein